MSADQTFTAAMVQMRTGLLPEPSLEQAIDPLIPQVLRTDSGHPPGSHIIQSPVVQNLVIQNLANQSDP